MDYCFLGDGIVFFLSFGQMILLLRCQRVHWGVGLRMGDAFLEAVPFFSFFFLFFLSSFVSLIVLVAEHGGRKAFIYTHILSFSVIE